MLVPLLFRNCLALSALVSLFIILSSGCAQAEFGHFIRGTFHTCRATPPAMLARDKGHIVNLLGGGTGNSFPRQ
jgi:hypothetical protein